jgi:cell division protein FtsI/penicillin-binding protein 2
MPAGTIGGGRQQRLLRKNAAFWYILFVAGFLGIVARLVLLQVIDHHDLQRRADDLYHREDVRLAAVRGRLLDRNNKVLALDDAYYVAYCDPTAVKDVAFTAQQLAPVLHLSAHAVTTALTKTQSFGWIKRDITADEAGAVAPIGAPGVEVRQDGTRWEVRIDFGRFRRTAGDSARFSKALGLREEDLEAQVGDLDVSPEDPAKAPTGIVPLKGTFSTRVKRAAALLNLRGVSFHDTQTPNYSVGVNSTPYLTALDAVATKTFAKQLAPVLNMSEDAVIARLQFRQRYAVIKKGLSEEETEGLRRLQGTFFVVSPGALLASHTTKDDPVKRLTDATKRLTKFLAGGDETRPEEQKTPPPTEAEVRERLLSGAKAGALGVRLTADGRPVPVTQWKLSNQPIDGVCYGLPGVAIEARTRRNYPYDGLAAQTLGFLNYAGDPPTGLFGLELSQETTLAGRPGSENKDVARNGEPVPGHYTRRDPIDGHDVVLTIDLGIQQAAEEELAKGVADAKARAGYCVVMDPRNGEILALASSPGWDANHPEPSESVPLVNPTVSNFYEPGSVFKLVAVMAALEEGVAHDGQIITNCTGAFPVGNRVIHEAKQEVHGAVDPGRLLEQSCNIGAAHLSLALGPDRFLKWCRLLGFGSRTGLGVEDESTGLLNERNVRRAKITLANAGFGQSVAVTPIQGASAYSVVANGGMWNQPHLIYGQMKANGELERFTPKTHPVCTKATANLMKGYFERVVTKGTGTAAAIPGYRVAGKTGTAQKVSAGGYGGGLAIGSFIGFMPVEDPRLCIIVVIDEPGGSHYGGVVAAPVVKAIGQRALQVLQIPPTETTTPS